MNLNDIDDLPLTDLELLNWKVKWLNTARDKQITPEGNWWTTWMVCAGRGFGKTLLGAQDLGQYACENAEVRCAVIAPTLNDVRAVCIEGESGLLSVIPPALIQSYNKSLLEIYLINGSIIRGFGSDAFDRLRGPQHHRAWCFVAGTLISMADGSFKSIESVQIGDKIMTRHGVRTVIDSGVSGNPNELVHIDCGVTSLTGTVDHPVLVGNSWIPMGELKTGDQLCVSTKDICTLAVRHAERLPNTVTYNLTVEGEHEYIANGIIVHNCDELAAWSYPEDTWSMMKFGLRLGENPQVIVTTTPKPIDLVRSFFDQAADEDSSVILTTGSTYENSANLAKSFIDEMSQLDGTKLGRQELFAELLSELEGGIVNESWFKLWAHDRPLPVFQYIVQSYDCATSDKTTNDPTACVVLGVFKPHDDKPMSVMVIDCWSEHMQYPDLRPKVIEEAMAVYGDENEFGQGKKVDLMLIEDKSAGIVLIQDLQRAGLPVRSYNPGRADKTMRLNLVAPLIMRGRVYLPESEERKGKPRKWLQPFVTQVCSFPNARHDDYVDALSQGLRVLRDMGFINIDPAPDSDYDDDERPRRQNPYAM